MIPTAPLIHPDYWMNSQLSIARFYGAIQIKSITYLVDKSSNYLVREDFAKFIGVLGFSVVEKAVKRHADAEQAKRSLSRLSRIVKARKRAKKHQEKGLF